MQAVSPSNEKMEKFRGDMQDQGQTIPMDQPPPYTPYAPSPQILPCVIPQTTKSRRGAFFSPFVRAYAPQLAASGIKQDEFLTFIDGLNEAFVANPVLQATGIVAGVMTQFYGIQPVQWAGMGLQLASGLGSAAISYARARAYIKAMNSDFFGPLGLHATVLTTKKMMDKVGLEEGKLRLPPLENHAVLDEATGNELIGIQNDDPKMRRIRALEGYVMPLDFNVPAAVEPDSMLRKMGNAQAARLARKQDKKLEKTRRKGEKRLRKGRGAEKKRREGDEKIAEVQHKIFEEETKFQQKSTSKKALEEPKEKAKIEDDHLERIAKLEAEIAKETAKRDKDVSKSLKEGKKKHNECQDKEEKIAQKIRWVVVSRQEDPSEEATSDDDILDDMPDDIPDEIPNEIPDKKEIEQISD